MSGSRPFLKIICFACFLFFILLPANPAAAHDGDLSHYKTHLRNAIKYSAKNTPEAKAQAYRELTSIKKVTFPDGSSVELRYPAINNYAGGLKALLFEIDRPSANKAVLAKGRVRLLAVLKRPEFHPESLAWYERLIDFIFKKILKIVALLPGPIIRWSAGLAALAALATGVGYIVRMFRRNMAVETALTEDKGPEMVMPADYRRFSLKAASIHDYRDALRFLFLAFLAELRERGIADIDTTYTNWEYVELIRASGNHDLAKRAADITGIFEVKWYGRQDCTPADYESFRKICKI